MVEKLVPDSLWALVFPLIPSVPSRPRGGRPRVHPRRVLAGILYILRWRQLPTALGFGSGITCERAFHHWQAQGLWSRLFQQVLNHAAAGGQLDWSRAALDGCSLPAPRGGKQTGRNPTDRGKLGSKLHLLIDATGVPLAITLTGANVHDSRQLEATLDAVHGVRTGQPGRPRRRPEKRHADKGDDFKRCRTACRARGIQPRIARRGSESCERLGRHRWKMERTLS